MRIQYYPIIAASFVISSFSSADDVKGWRNGGNGLFPEANPALDWKDGSKVKWETPISSRSNASPIVVDGKLFLTAEPATLICADAESGKILWEKGNEYSDLLDLTPEERAKADEAKAKAAEAAKKAEPLERDLYRAERQLRRKKGDKALEGKVAELKKQIAAIVGESGSGPASEQKPKAHDTNGYSSYTPVSDGKHVFACFGIGVVVGYDFDGKRIWHKRLENPDHSWGGASSPTLVDGKLIVRFKDYHALDPATGEELWKTPSEGVVFNAPANFELEGKSFLITSRGELIRADDGEKLWSAGYVNKSKEWSFMNTPSVIGKRVYFAHGSEGDQGDAYCLEIPSTIEAMDKDGLKEIWHTQVAKNRYYSSPLVVDGVVHLISRDYDMQALDAATGKLHYEQKVKGLTGTAYPSLTLAGEVIVVGAEDGRVAFVKPGKVFEEIARTEVKPFRSSAIFADGVGYLRTQESLMAIKAD
ncbi:PQQ-binding-like beta-propeller repeat protein [Haloferula chungangensis]|uniref:PQQ-binding-like beta-propeller repeat protein n=1 Tax=Haloferula chungangensis TaxID=1048331 RepID=A0ABW2LE77_9BACT